MKIYEVIPIEYDKTRKVIHTYKRIITRNLTANRLRDIYLNLRFKSLPMISNLLGFFLITYQPKPPILISKDNGRLYAFQGKWDLAEVQHQASLVMRVLASVGLVEEHKRRTIKRKR